MRPETKDLLRKKTKTLTYYEECIDDPKGQWIHVRDVKSLLRTESDLLQKTINKRNQQLSQFEGKTVDYFQYRNVLVHWLSTEGKYGWRMVEKTEQKTLKPVCHYANSVYDCIRQIDYLFKTGVYNYQ